MDKKKRISPKKAFSVSLFQKRCNCFELFITFQIIVEVSEEVWKSQNM